MHAHTHTYTHACAHDRTVGLVKPGDEVEIMGLRDPVKTIVTGVEMFKKSMQQGQVRACACVCGCLTSERQGQYMCTLHLYDAQAQMKQHHLLMVHMHI